MKFSIMRSIDTKRYPSLIGQSVEDLERFSIALGQPSFRGRQLFDWIYRKKVDDFTQMTDLPKLFQEKLKGYSLHPLKILNTNSSSSKKTQKYLLTTKKGMTIESVLMRKKIVLLSVSQLKWVVQWIVHFVLLLKWDLLKIYQLVR